MYINYKTVQIQMLLKSFAQYFIKVRKLPLLAGFVKVVLYMVFMVIMIKVHTFPLFAIRPMYLAMR